MNGLTKVKLVTILILVDGFLQFIRWIQSKSLKMRHNPYFSRWFSAIEFSFLKCNDSDGHNPYFSRWFSAIIETTIKCVWNYMSQSLF